MLTADPGGRDPLAGQPPALRAHLAGLPPARRRHWSGRPSSGTRTIPRWCSGTSTTSSAATSRYDYSDQAAEAFRIWLRATGTTTSTRSTTPGAPGSGRSATPTSSRSCRRGWRRTSVNPGGLLDFRRFSSDALLDLLRLEKQVIRDAGATQPITTNFIGRVPVHRLPALGGGTRRHLRRQLPRSARPGVVPGDRVRPRPDAVAEARHAVDPDGTGPERGQLAAQQRAQGARADGRAEHAGGRARRRRGAVLPVAAGRRGRGEVPLRRCCRTPAPRPARSARSRPLGAELSDAGRAAGARRRGPGRGRLRLALLVGDRPDRPPGPVRLPGRGPGWHAALPPAQRPGRRRADRRALRRVRPGDRARAST